MYGNDTPCRHACYDTHLQHIGWNVCKTASIRPCDAYGGHAFRDGSVDGRAASIHTQDSHGRYSVTICITTIHIHVQMQLPSVIEATNAQLVAHHALAQHSNRITTPFFGSRGTRNGVYMPLTRTPTRRI